MAGEFDEIRGRLQAISEELADLAIVRLRESIDAGGKELPVDPGDWRLRHKSTDRGFYEAALFAAREAGAAEAIFVRPDGLVTEGSISNVFVECAGKLVTPPAALGLLPGILRRRLIDEGHAEAGEVTLDDLAGGFLVGNALRGLMKAALL